MAKRKQKLTAAEKVEKKRRKKEYKTIFINGKQKRVKKQIPQYHAFFMTAGKFFFNEFNASLTMVSSFWE